jgi:fatty-acyl-CoA synthase
VPTFSGPPLETEEGLGSLTMGGFLEEVCGKYAGREAICFGDRSATQVRWSYEELLERSRLLARALAAKGVGKGTRVGLLMGNRPEWVESCFAVALCGGVLVPLNTLFEEPEIEHVLKHSDASVVLHQQRLGHHDYGGQLDAIASRLPFLSSRHCLGTDGYDELLAGAREFPEASITARAEEVSPYDDALVVYTSGSTGRPKGVLHAHRAAAIQSWRFRRHLRLDETARVWSAFPFFWTAGFCMVMGGTLAAGGCLVLQELFEPGEALAMMERERVTTAHAWPHQMAALESHEEWERFDLSSIRQVESFTSLSRHPSVAVGDPWSPRSAYGLTETFTIITSTPADAPPEDREGHEGAILPGNALRVVDDSGNELAAGCAGEIRAKGPTLMKGYLKVAPEDVFDDQGFFPTGDAGYVDELGRLHWSGRTNDLIKTGGANVSPVEIETELLHHPLLQSALAVGVSHPTLDQMVVVCAVAARGRTVTEDEVRDFLKGKIASYKLPRRVLFFEEDELVLTGNAKIKVDELRALAEARLTEESHC